MPKMKTNRAAAKRFRFTGSGKIRRRYAGHSHILTKKSTKRKRVMRSPGLVNAADVKRVVNLLGGKQ